MKILVVLMCLVAFGCTAQKPHPCKSPPLLTGSFSLSSQSEKITAFANYIYDAERQRIRLTEYGKLGNQTFILDGLLLYKEGVMYEIDIKNHICKKFPLQTDFHPMEIPKGATFTGQMVVGSSSEPGQGLLINTWAGEMYLNQTVKYMTCVTEFGCIPVTTFFRTDVYGWIMQSFVNNVKGITDPGQLIPPYFCRDVEMDLNSGPADFYTLFAKKNLEPL